MIFKTVIANELLISGNLVNLCHYYKPTVVNWGNIRRLFSIKKIDVGQLETLYFLQKHYRFQFLIKLHRLGVLLSD